MGMRFVVECGKAPEVAEEILSNRFSYKSKRPGGKGYMDGGYGRNSA
jgi:hypothetical protein